MNDQLQFVKSLGAGGFGHVVQMRVATTGQLVAVKYFKKFDDPAIKKRFIREIEETQKLTHSGIVKILGSVPDNAGYIMPYYPNGSLREKFSPDTHAPENREAIALGFFSQVLEPLAFAHANGVIHRDLKPDNILFDENDMAIICDWGIGKFTNRDTEPITNGPIGTKEYWAPEQAKNGHGDARSDIYSLGIILVEMLTGSRDPKIGVPNLSPRTRRIVQKCTQQDPALRYQTVRQLQDGLNSPEPVMPNPAQANSDEVVKLVFGAAAVVGLLFLVSRAK